jgi:hypothetical protein
MKDTNKLNIELLIPERLSYWCQLIDIPEEAIAALQTMAAQVREDADMAAIFYEAHEKTAIRGEWHREWSPLPLDPAVEAKYGEDTSLFYLLLYLAALPHTWERYQRLDIGLDIFKATMLDFRFYIQDYFDSSNRWGYAMFGWIWRHLTIELFRLGRLQYLLMPFEGGVRAFRRKGENTSTSSIILLANPEMPLRADGCAWGAGRPRNAEIPPENEETWRPIFESSADGWRGHTVSPYGWVEHSPTYLPAGEWEMILQPGDLVLEMHIPRKDLLNAETCGASYAQALDFFRRVFPDRPSKALFCHTWIFTAQLQQFLPPESNLVKFQREFYLYPQPGTVNYLWTFVFGAKHEDPLTAPRDTSLRRAVLDCLNSGGEIFDLAGLMFHSPQEWGTQPYMTNSKS